MKNIILIVIISAAHFTVSKLTPSMTLLLLDSGVRDAVAIGFLIKLLVINAVAIGFLIKLLVITTKVLYFPLLTFSLYSRQWFPGYWINIVIIANSLLWAVSIFISIVLIRRMRHPV